jgi:hypothetical protein
MYSYSPTGADPLGDIRPQQSTSASGPSQIRAKGIYSARAANSALDKRYNYYIQALRTGGRCSSLVCTGDSIPLLPLPGLNADWPRPHGIRPGKVPGDGPWPVTRPLARRLVLTQTENCTAHPREPGLARGPCPQRTQGTGTRAGSVTRGETRARGPWPDSAHGPNAALGPRRGETCA